jgi:hypothetical protein
VNSSLNSSHEAKHIFPVRISCRIMRSAKVAARPPLKYDRAQWMRTWSLTKSDWVGDMYSSQDVRNARPCTLSPLWRVVTPSEGWLQVAVRPGEKVRGVLLPLRC